MPYPQLFLSAAHGDAVEQIFGYILRSNVSTLLSGPVGIGKTAVLNVVAAKLALRSRRVVRVSAASKRPFGMHELSAQLAGLPQADDHVIHARHIPPLQVIFGLIRKLDGSQIGHAA